MTTFQQFCPLHLLVWGTFTFLLRNISGKVMLVKWNTECWSSLFQRHITIAVRFELYTFHLEGESLNGLSDYNLRRKNLLKMLNWFLRFHGTSDIFFSKKPALAASTHSMYWSLSYLIGVDSMTKHGRQKINLCEGGISQKSRDICWRQPFFYMHLLFKDDIKTSNF